MPSLPPADADLIVSGFANFLQANDVASWDGSMPAYTVDTPWPIFRGPDVPATPHQLIVLTPTTVARRASTIVQGLQVRLRGAEGENAYNVRARAQMIDDLCNPNGFPAAHLQMGAIRVGAILPGDQTPIDADGRGRHGWVLNYAIRYRKTRPRTGLTGFGEGGYGEGAFGD